MKGGKLDKTKLLKVYADNLAKSDNRNHYLTYAKRFLDSADGLDRASVDRFITDMALNYKPSSVNFAFRVIRRLFNVNDLPWPYRKGEAPAIGQRDEYRPQLSTRIIEMMITAAKTDRLLPHEQCFLALSTIYGLRRGELANLKPDDIDLKHGVFLYVATMKAGRERYHLIPNEVRPYIEAHDFNDRWAVATMTQVLKRILAKSGAGELRKHRLGWHGIRRALLDGLIDNGVSVLAARAFLRWKGGEGDMAMPARYYGNVVVDLAETGPVLEEAKGDEEIFERHPFLPFWGEKGICPKEA